MATEVLMPKLGLTMTEGTIEEWKYKEGDAVKKGKAPLRRSLTIFLMIQPWARFPGRRRRVSCTGRP